MDVLVLDESLVELVYPRLLVEMVEDVDVVPELGPQVEVGPLLDALTQPDEKSHDLVVHAWLAAIKQVFLLQLSENPPLGINLMSKFNAIIIIIDTETQEQFHDVLPVLEVSLHDFQRSEEEDGVLMDG